MVTVRKIDNKEKQTIESVVQIHLETFSGFFLTFMGRGFLRQMYRSYCEHMPSGLLGAFEENGELVGFLAYSSELSGLYKYMIQKRLIPFAWYALGAFLRKPKVFLRLVRALLKPSESVRDETYVELASIGVSPVVKGKGVGSLLIDNLKRRVDFGVFSYINLETDAEQNEAANAFYVKNGFILTRRFTTREGRVMNEYRFGEKQ